MKMVTLIGLVTLVMMAMSMVVEIVMLMANVLIIVMMAAVMSTEMMAKSDDGGGGLHPRTTFPALPPGKMRGHTFRQDDHHQHAGHDHHLVAL